ncbi:MAG: phosphotransferase family protein [Thermodesulfobacteriota bacterium]
MKLVPASDPLIQALRQLLSDNVGISYPLASEVYAETLPSSRQVLRFTFPEGGAVVGKFFSAYPPQGSADLSLAREYDNYRQLPALGVTNGQGLVPQLLGRWPQHSLGLLLEAVPGPDLDNLICQACLYGDTATLFRGLENLAQLLAFFHSRPLPVFPVSPDPALSYLDKLVGQLQGAGLLNREDSQALKDERTFWAARVRAFSDEQVLVHGDATPTNFLFPNGRAVALDLEKLRFGDRLWDLSWVAGELKHAWGWRLGNMNGAETAVGHFFRAYLAAAELDPSVADRLYSLNPFYMALAELRIARNHYLTFDYRRELVAEARRCLASGRGR